MFWASHSSWVAGLLLLGNKMTILHSAILDADRHEPKGASTATIRKVLLSNGDGTTKFDFVAFTDITGRPSAILSAAVISSASTGASQNPTGSNSNTVVVFGPAVSTADVSLAATGILTFVTGGPYLVQADLNFGRDAGTTPSVMYVRVLKNGVAYGNPIELRMSETVSRRTVSMALAIPATAADTLQFQFISDSAGDGGGGLRQDTPSAAGWTIVPCAKLTVSKFINLS